MAKTHTVQSTYQLDARLNKAAGGKKPPAKPKHQPYFKPHFPHVVAYAYFSRYVTSDQVYCRFPNVFNHKRTCDRHINQLVYLGYLSVIHPTLEPTFPNVYTTTAKGRTLIKGHIENLVIPGNVRDEVMQLTNILHELYLTDFQLYIWQAIESRDDLQIKGRPERRYYLKQNKKHLLEFAHQGVSDSLQPDAGFLLAHTKGEDTKLLFHLVEMDMGTENLKTFYRKLTTYDDWSHSEEGIAYLKHVYEERGRTTTSPIFRLLVLLSDRKHGDFNRLLNTYIKALDLPPSTRNTIWFATMEDIEAASQTDLPLTQPIWYRGRDARDWIEDYEIFVAHLKQGRGQKPHQHKKTYVTLKLKTMQRAQLLPKPV